MVKKILNDDATELSASKFALLDVSATWCGPCKILAPIIEELSEEYAGKVDFYNADAEENPELSQKLGVRNIPYIAFFKNGELIANTVGVQQKESLSEWIDACMA